MLPETDKEIKYMKAVFKQSFTALSVSIALSACNLAPKYEQPNVALPSSTFRYDVQEPQAIQAASLGWKDYFADPRLHALIELALKNNTDLRTANLNVEKIRTQYAITRAANLPSLSGTAGAGRNGSHTAAGSNVANSYNTGLGISGFELDLWGRIRNSNESALESYFAQAATRDATHLSLIASVAKAYFAEQSAIASMDLSQRTLKAYQQTYELAKVRHKAGVISALELRSQESQIEGAKSDYAAAVNSREVARNALELLISQKVPDDLPTPLPMNKQFKIRNLPAGLSSNLLLNRPDIIAAEHSLKAANANIGAARAALFPNINLTTTLGLSSAQLSNLFSSPDRSWGYNANATIPIFNWGKNKADVVVSKIAQEQALIAYESAVETAFQDVSNALVARAAFNSQYESAVAQGKANSERLRLTRLRYKHGVSSALDLLDAERSSYASDVNLLSRQQNLLENLADLYKVLGGGLKRYTTDEQTMTQQVDADLAESHKTTTLGEMKDALKDATSRTRDTAKKVTEKVSEKVEKATSK